MAMMAGSAAGGDNGVLGGGDVMNVTGELGADNFLFGRDQLFRERVLQRRQTASGQQGRILVNLGDQTFLRGDRKHLFLFYAQVVRDGRNLVLDLALYLFA